MDVIPYARSVYNGEWLNNDWYLNLKIPYRFLFSYPVGYFSDKFGFLETIYAGRIISYVFFAISINRLINTIRAPKSFIYYNLALIVFFSFFGLGSGAGEWMVGGLDTKVFAYGFILLSISYFIEKDLKKCLAFSGLALSLHLLIGFYNILSFIPLILIYHKHSSKPISEIIKLLPFFIIPSSIGLYGIITQLTPVNDSISNIGWDIYVNIRVPHHTIPSLFSKKTWLFLILFSITNVLILLNTKIFKLKLISIYALATVTINIVGLIVFFIYGNSHLLKYYFFRFSDVMLPLITTISITYYFSEKIKMYSIKTRNIIHSSTIIVVLMFYILSVEQLYSELKSNSNTESYDLDLITWVKNNTDSNDSFIINPNLEMFYINYERPIFVSWKHSPQNNNDIIEWYNRLKLLNGGSDFTTLDNVTYNYPNLSENQILSIQQSYKNIKYIIMPKPKTLNFPILHQTSKNTLYEITNFNEV